MRTVICIILVWAALFQSCSLSTRSAGDNSFVGYANELLDSTFKFYRVPEYCLFNEDYPKQENERITYLASNDTIREDKVAYLWPTSGLFSAVNALLKATKEKKYDTLLQNVILPGLERQADGLFPDEQFVKDPRKKEHKWLLTQAALIEMYARLSTLKQ